MKHLFYKIFAILAISCVAKTNATTTEQGDPKCTSPTERGACEGSVQKFTYTCEENACFPFIYSGCGGNANRFDTLAQCEEACKKGKASYCTTDSDKTGKKKTDSAGDNTTMTSTTTPAPEPPPSDMEKRKGYLNSFIGFIG